MRLVKNLLGVLLLGVLLIGALVAVPACAEEAQGDSSHAGAPPATQAAGGGHAVVPGQFYGGMTVASIDHNFEVVFDPKDIRVFIYDAKKTPVKLLDERGTITVGFKNSTPKVLHLDAGDPAEGEALAYYCTMHPEEVQFKPGSCPKCGMELTRQDRLFARADFSAVPADTMTFQFHIVGLSGKEPEVNFTEVYKPTFSAGTTEGAGRTKAVHKRTHPKSEAGTTQ